jgi:hypothetical protein
MNIVSLAKRKGISVSSSILEGEVKVKVGFISELIS